LGTARFPDADEVTKIGFFTKWIRARGDDDLIASAKQYRYKNRTAMEWVQKAFFSNSLPKLQLKDDYHAVVAGYGLGLEDELVAQLFGDYNPQGMVILAFDRSAAEAKRQDILQGGDGTNCDVVVCKGAPSRQVEDRRSFFAMAFRLLGGTLTESRGASLPPQV